MKYYTYHAEVMTMIEQFTAAFNDIIVKGYDEKGDLINNSSKEVRFIYAPKQRVYESLITPGPGGITVPVVSISLGGISRDKSRVFNKIDGFNIPYHASGKSPQLLKNIPQPIPVNLTINMSILTRYQEHMDQIISNFVPYCDPYIIISWKFPGIDNSTVPFEIRSEVLWDGTIRNNYPAELQPNQAYRMSADTSFTIKGWLFKKMDELVEKIFYINADFSAVNQTSILEKFSTEYISISAIPNIRAVNPTKLYLWPLNDEKSVLNNLNIDLYGKYFFDIKNIYLSASNPNTLSGVEYWDQFNYFSKLSSFNPPFSAVKIPEFKVSSDNFISFNLPQIPAESGYIDIIVENEAGYDKLTTSNINFMVSSWPGWVQEPSPYENGLFIGVS